jgi:hypothetical protein
VKNWVHKNPVSHTGVGVSTFRRSYIVVSEWFITDVWVSFYCNFSFSNGLQSFQNCITVTTISNEELARLKIGSEYRG